MAAEVELPDRVRTTALAQGDLGEQWLRDLPDIVRTLEQRWGITTGAVLEGGTAGYVAEATTATGDAFVLKVHMPARIELGDASHHRVLALELAAGRGCVCLHASDDDLAAMLLERPGRDLHSRHLAAAEQSEILAATVRQMWVPVPPDVSLPRGDEKARWHAGYIRDGWDKAGRPCARRTIDTALAYAEERASSFDRTTAVLVHGDAHSLNALEAGEGSFKLIDPDGLVSEPAHDLGIVMREVYDDLVGGDAKQLGRELAHLLGELTGVDAEAIWQWCLVERVSSGLYAAFLGHEDWAHHFLEIADLWSA